MITFVTQLPGWLIEYRWLVCGALILGMAGLVLALVFNPRGRQLREILRRK